MGAGASRPVDPEEGFCTVCCCVPWCLPCVQSSEQRNSWRFWWWRRFNNKGPSTPASAEPGRRAERISLLGSTSEREQRLREREAAMRRAQAIVEKNRASKKKRFSITFSNPFRRGSSSSYDGRR